MDQIPWLEHDGAMLGELNVSLVIMGLIGLCVGLISVLFYFLFRANRKSPDESFRAEELLKQTQKIEEQSARIESLTAEKAALETKLEMEQKRLEEKEKAWIEARDRMIESFQSLSKQALESNNQSFLTLAQTQLQKLMEVSQKDLQLRQERIANLVQPVKESLERVDQKLQAIEKNRSSSEGALKEQVQLLVKANQDLRHETHGLVSALRAPQARGRWGEMQLRRVAEMSGMIAYCDFNLQASETVEEGRLRPDMVVRLPGGKQIVVDAKTPLIAYLDAIQISDPDQRREKLKEHAKHIRKHIDDLSKKSYWLQFQPSPEFVVLFLPGEHFFSAALEADAELIEAGVSQNVIIATPTTLISLLRAASYGWQQERLTENVRQVGKLGQELYKRVSDMTDHFVRLGKNLDQSVSAYNSAMATLETRVLVSARKMNEMNALPGGSEIASLPVVDTQARNLNAEELR